ncbi:hypothetical protein FQK01_24975 [Xanthomonas vasicola]|uniref:Uncharacterized protein n=1 Tax=Xanthomonas vasicola TaxID=56459 RepID=A0ABD7S463_XANVA|nr:hypothetical protein FQK01_24975 [Xanthomonas vasicola]
MMQSRHIAGATAMVLGAGLAWTALAGPAAGGSWATVAGYYPGMPKEAARKPARIASAGA